MTNIHYGGSLAAGGDLRVDLRPQFLAAGFELVKQDISYLHDIGYNALADVWRSPAAGNSSGADWYLIVFQATQGTTVFAGCVPTEGFNTADNTLVKPCPHHVTANVAPGPDFAMPNASYPISQHFFYPFGVSTSTTTSTTYTLHATPDRVILDGGTYCWYSGLMKKTLGLEGRTPLGCIDLRQNPSGSSSNTKGNMTRDPGQTVASANNFAVQLAGTSDHVRPVSPGATVVESYTGKLALGEVSVRGSRFTSGLIGLSLRAVLLDVVTTGRSQSAGDTLTVDMPNGTSRTYRLVNAGNGIFVPNEA